MSRPTRADASGRAYLDLQNRARREGRSTQELLTLYALERFLARLAMSQYAGTFVLKGGMLLAALNARRATVDADLLATDLDNQEAAVLQRIIEIAALIPEFDDGVRFNAQAAKVRIIREAATYAGVRVTMDARVSSATVKLQLDINFGDPITPGPLEIEYPTLRPEMPPVRVLGYPLATVLAEKLSTAVDLGQANSRVRDYADLWTLTRIHDIDGAELSAAIHATASHRGVGVRPLSEVVADLGTVRAATYSAYRRRIRADAGSLPHDFADLVDEVIEFADPVLSDSLESGSWWQAASRSWLAAPIRSNRA